MLFLFSSEDTLEWKDSTEAVVVEDLTAIVGPAVHLPPTTLETFQLFFTSILVSLIVDQTNSYTSQVLGEEASTKWSDVTEGDFLAFLGFVVLMGDQSIAFSVTLLAKEPHLPLFSHCRPDQ